MRIFRSSTFRACPCVSQFQRILRHKSTVSEDEIRTLSHTSSEWWDPKGPFAALHHYNPTRVRYIRSQVTHLKGLDPNVARPFEGLRILDIGCGGGILSESLCRLGAQVTGVDASGVNIEAAEHRRQQQQALHPQLQSLSFVHSTAEELQAQGHTYDVIVASEVPPSSGPLPPSIPPSPPSLPPPSPLMLSQFFLLLHSSHGSKMPKQLFPGLLKCPP